jgi:hypothetical protein
MGHLCIGSHSSETLCLYSTCRNTSWVCHLQGIFRRYPNQYEFIIAQLCDNLYPWPTLAIIPAPEL